MKIDGFALEEKSSFKVLVLTFSSEFNWGSYIFSIAKTVSKKIGALICFMKFLSPEVAFYLCILRIVRQATKLNMLECWSFTCSFS